MDNLAFVNVDVVPAVGEDALLRAQTVLVNGERIVTMGPSALVDVPGNARRIDGAGKTLIPGLCDMHVHIEPRGISESEGVPSEQEALRRARQYLLIFLANGVTTVRNMAGTPLHLKLRAEVAQGTTLGPSIFTAGPILETRFTFPALEYYGQLVRTPAEARAAVLAHKQAGYDFIKVYNDIDAPVYDEIVRTAREVGLPVVGHVAYQKGLEGALQARQDSIEHLRSYDFAVDTRSAIDKSERFVGWLYATPQRIAEVAERTAAAGVWNVPTLIVERDFTGCESLKVSEPELPEWVPAWLIDSYEKSLAPSTIFSAKQLADLRAGMGARLEMVKALEHVGAPLMVGTDCPGCRLVPGRSLLQELELYVQAGLSPLSALRAATIRAAQFLGLDMEQGSVTVGKRADLLLLDGNPLEDIRAVYRQAGICLRGSWFPRSEVAALLASSERM